jgi:hypothetical protein
MTSQTGSSGFLDRGRLGAFASLFLLLLCLLFVPTLLPQGPLLRWLLAVVFTLLMIAAIQASSADVRDVRRAVALALPPLALKWLSDGSAPLLTALGAADAALFLAFVTSRILRFILRARVVDTEVILAALCVYLLLGIIWTEAYVAVAALDPAAFSLPAQATAGEDPASAVRRALGYFSFVTLTTLGYGDVTPLSGSARGLAVLEAIFGQLYLVTMIARLVALQVERERETADTADQPSQPFRRK